MFLKKHVHRYSMPKLEISWTVIFDINIQSGSSGNIFKHILFNENSVMFNLYDKDIINVIKIVHNISTVLTLKLKFSYLL